MNNVIGFETQLYTIGTTTLFIVPSNASAKLPSRGQTLVKGTINGVDFVAALGPDGRGSHWWKVDEKMQKKIEAKAGDTVTLEFEPSKDWPDPDIPQDLKVALDSTPKVKLLWENITPMARWDWIRWINATLSESTRSHRIEVAFSKLKHGSKRPCCFNRTMCTDPYVSKSGVLLRLEPSN